MSETGLTLDMADFMNKSEQILINAIPGAAGKGLFRAASQLKIDADELFPKTPHLHGALRDITSKVIKEEEFIAAVTYEEPYAHRWHECGPGGTTGEDEPNWSEEGVGPKWLEAKMMRSDLQKNYLQIITDTIKEEGG